MDELLQQSNGNMDKNLLEALVNRRDDKNPVHEPSSTRCDLGGSEALKTLKSFLASFLAE
jgi:hypothetical protein